MKTVIDQFRTLADDINRNSLLELVEFRVEPPVTEQEISRIEAEARLRLPQAVKRFYLVANGLTLRWRFRRDLSPAQQDAIMRSFPAPQPTRHELTETTGNVQLLSLSDLLLNSEYDVPSDNPTEGSFDFEQVMYSDNEFSVMLQPFDIVDDYFCMAFVAQPEADDWKLMMLGDHWVEYDSSRVVLLEDYLQFVIATYGLRRARPALFRAYRGDRQPLLRYDERLAGAVLPSVLLAG